VAFSNGYAGGLIFVVSGGGETGLEVMVYTILAGTYAHDGIPFAHLIAS
jgi:hypothetical protein